MRRLTFLASLRERLAVPWLNADAFRSATVLLWRSVFLGTLLYLVLVEDPIANLRLNIAAYIVAVGWCYYDGVFSRRLLMVAWFEGVLLYLAGIQVGRLLALVLGSPVPI